MTSSSLFFFRLFVFRLVSRDENRAADPRRTLPLSWLRMILVVLFVETSEPPKAVGTCWFGSWEQTSIGDCHRVLLAVVAWLCSESVPLCWSSCRRPFRHDLRRGQKVWSVAWRTTVALVQKSWDCFRFSTFFTCDKSFRLQDWNWLGHTLVALDLPHIPNLSSPVDQSERKSRIQKLHTEMGCSMLLVGGRVTPPQFQTCLAKYCIAILNFDLLLLAKALWWFWWCPAPAAANSFTGSWLSRSTCFDWNLHCHSICKSCPLYTGTELTGPIVVHLQLHDVQHPR